jgi:DNA replication and repair protein RecF
VLLARLEADRVRNLKKVQLELGEGLTIILGENAQGKTSLLEAVYLLATGRSFRTRKLDEIVSWDGPPARAAGEISSRVGVDRLAVTVGDGVRRLLADGIEQELEDYLGRVDVVDLTGDRMKVLRGGPEERRRFLDRGAVGIRPSYLRELGRYRRTLAQRNALLRRGHDRPSGQRMAELEAWEERLGPASFVLHRERRLYCEALDAHLGEIGRRIFPGKRKLVVRYRPSPATTGEQPLDRFEELFAAGIAGTRERDLALGHTSVGPHRDDLVVELDGIDLRKYGSAGQVRASMVGLKLSKLSLLREAHGEPPLFLMDDFDTDLDEIRAAAVADFLRHGGFQALVATSKETLVGRLGVAAELLRMSEGVARAA